MRLLVLLALPMAPVDAAVLAALEKKVDPRSCMGTWFVQQQIPALALLEDGARNGVEEYTWDEENGHFSVRYTFSRSGGDAKMTVSQRGWIASENPLGTRWEVAPVLPIFGRSVCLPVRLPFIVIDVDPDAYLICSGGLTSWLYILTRERQPAGSLTSACLATVEAAGFDMQRLQAVEHDPE